MEFLKVMFEGYPALRFDYAKTGWRSVNNHLELAYAITIHKSQGSEFGKTFVVIPNPCRLLSRELLYTALTRARRTDVRIRPHRAPSHVRDAAIHATN